MTIETTGEFVDSSSVGIIRLERAVPATTHTVENWTGPAVLRRFGYWGVNFDFFVDLSDRKSLPLRRVAWLKRRLPVNLTVADFSDADLADAVANDSDLAASCSVVQALGFDVRAMILEDRPSASDWDEVDDSYTPVAAVSVAADSPVAVERLTLADLKDRIVSETGMSFRPGKQINRHLPTALEEHLYFSGAPWPGDADMVVVDENRRPLAVVEFKAHTKEYSLSRGLPSLPEFRESDELKWKRLLALADRIEAPLVAVTWPTSERHRFAAVQRCFTQNGRPEFSSARTIPLGEDRNAPQPELAEAILDAADRRRSS